MVRAALTTPLYVSSIWVLLITYQMFTHVAVISVVQSLSQFLPSAQELLIPRIDRIEFVYSFAWIWVMTSLIPSLILRRKSALLQFVIVLILTFLALEFESILSLTIGREVVRQIFAATFLLMNPILAALYLLSPFLIILIVDFYDKRRRKLEKKVEQSVHARQAVPKGTYPTSLPNVPEKDEHGTFSIQGATES
ncbi:MAG: hypothetical protein JSV58_04435 [Candidatus Bathyarchaeota archaeon]|nr:MAG: hypothetical protein JSV58_04435 [Candidatus Bathyarchaeota archaeon]